MSSAFSCLRVSVEVKKFLWLGALSVTNLQLFLCKEILLHGQVMFLQNIGINDRLHGVGRIVYLFKFAHKVLVDPVLMVADICLKCQALRLNSKRCDLETNLAIQHRLSSVFLFEFNTNA